MSATITAAQSRITSSIFSDVLCAIAPSRAKATSGVRRCSKSTDRKQWSSTRWLVRAVMRYRGCSARTNWVRSLACARGAASWEVENHGIAPDIEVENDPASVAAGHDPQLEKAVQVTLEALKKNPVVIPDHPQYPNYHQKM